jgi:signal transduction histidine kinase
MRLRALLALQLLFTYLVIILFLVITINQFWDRYGFYLPTSIPIAEAVIPLQSVGIAYSALFLVLIALTLCFMFLLLDRLIIRPVQLITHAMSTFAATNKLEPLPRMSLATSEIKNLRTVFLSFTDSVEQVHERDLEISRVKSDFISTAAHQLRTPLTGIRWALEALLKEQLTEMQQKLVADAANKSRDLVSIVGTLLDISSIESGKHKYQFELVQFSELVQSVVSDFMHQAAECSVSLVLQELPSSVPQVRADRQQIKWILNNLIENAIRYTPAGGRVSVSLECVADRLVIKVRDTGIGITRKDQNNIFERFYRAENAVAKQNKGNGLGLYISRQIALDHGGELSFAANEDGIGTTFTLVLPFTGPSPVMPHA